jgi:hypothetical protein
MKDSPSNTTIRLKIGNDEIVIRSPEEFELALRPRLDVRSLKHAQISVLTDEALKEELEGIRALEQVLMDVLAQSMSQPGRIGKFLKRLNLNLITMDNEWREIFAAVARIGVKFDAYKQVAAVQYLEYLGQRKDLIKAIKERRQHHQQRHSKTFEQQAEDRGSQQPRRDVSPRVVLQESFRSPEPPPAPRARLRSNRISRGTIDEIDISAVGDPLDLDTRQKLLFDFSALSSNEQKGVTFGRMSKGVSVTVHFEVYQVLSLMLAMHEFWIVAGDPFRFIDNFGHDVSVPFGKSVIGRSHHSEVPVDQSYNVISRRHLMLDLERDCTLRLTDMSSYGTYVPIAYLNPLA